MVMHTVYEKKPDSPMKVAFLFSGGATGLKTAYNDNPDLGKLYDVGFCFTDKPDCKGAIWARENDLEVVDKDYKAFVRDFPSKREGRIAYFDLADEVLKDLNPDLIVTTGFMLLIPEPFVKNWYGKIINGHPAKTYVLVGPDGDIKEVGDFPTQKVNQELIQNGYNRRFIGDDAVYDAVLAGAEDVRTSVFFLDEGEDTGPNIVHSPPLMVDVERVQELQRKSDSEGLREYADSLQEELKYKGDGPAINKTLELAASGRLGFDGETVFLDSKPLPYGGHLMESE